MDAQASFGTHADAEIDLYRGGRGFLRLYVLAADGSNSVEFVHPTGGDAQRSIAFLWSLSEQARRMAGELARHAPADDAAEPGLAPAPAVAASVPSDKGV
jgi:hypothetical protein